MKGSADRLVDHNRQKKAAVINDFTSFGRCSLAVTIPILSAMKVQCCPVPTAFFTNHTGFDSFAWTDNTPHLDEYIAEWRKLGLRFDAIQTGFLGSH
jgi:pyridoxine kinase